MNKHKVLLQSQKLFQLNALTKKMAIVLIAKTCDLYSPAHKQKDLFLSSFCCTSDIIITFIKRAIRERFINLVAQLGGASPLSRALVDDFKDGNHFKSTRSNFPLFFVLVLLFLGTKNKSLVSVSLIANKLSCLPFCLSINKSYFPLLANLVSC